MKHFFSFCIVIAVFTCSTVFASPYNGKKITFTQPDGSKVEVTLYGDEFHMRAETKDGYTVLRDPATQWICYAKLNNDSTALISSGVKYKKNLFTKYNIHPYSIGKIQKHIDIPLSHKNKSIQKNKSKLGYTLAPEIETIKPNEIQTRPLLKSGAAPTVQTIKGITILVDFSDAPSTVSKAEYDSLWNGSNYTGYGCNGSVKKYFKDVSGGTIIYETFVFGVLRAPKRFAEYDAMCYACGAQEILGWALNEINKQGFDFSQLTKDQWGQIKAMNFMYTGNPQNWAQGMWFHAGGYNGFEADGMRSGSYACASANAPLGIGIAAHENGHMLFNWPDTYKYNGDNGPSGIGGFDLMCWYGGDQNPVPPNQYFLYKSGLATAEDVTGFNGTKTDIANDNKMYKFTNPTNTSEYYLFSNLQKTGRYANIPDHGLTIWHVNELGNNQEKPNPPTQTHEVFLEHANNNIEDQAGACFKLGRKTEFTDITTPSAKWYDNKNSTLSVTNISTSANTMSYTFGSSVYLTLNNYWYFHNTMSNWGEYNDLSTQFTENYAIINITGSDPYMKSPDNIQMLATEYKYVVVSMKNNTAATTAELFWTTTTSPGFDGNKMIQFPIIPNDTKQRYYIIDLSQHALWAGTIKQIRLDPTTQVTSGTVNLDFIKLLGTYPTSPIAIPGTVQVQDYNRGGQNNAYSDKDVANNGGAYRTSDAVDIEPTGDATGSYNIGWTAPGEWTEYLIDVTETGTYTINIRAAAPTVGAQIQLQLNGENLGNVIQLANTAGYQTYENNTFTAQLTKGKQILRLISVTGGYNSNYISFEKYAPITITPYTQINGGMWEQTNTAIVCAGGSVMFGPHPVVESGWTWTGPNGFTANTRAIHFTNIATNKAGNYVATYTDASGNKGTQTFTITVNTIPTATISTTTPTTFCQGGSVVLTTSAGSSYKWFNGTTEVATTATYTTSTSGSYTVEVTNANGCKATSVATVVTVHELPSATVTTTTASNGLANGSIAFAFTDNPSRTNIAFSIDNGATYNSVADNLGTYTFTAVTAGKYKVYTHWGNAECPVYLGEYTVPANLQITLAQGWNLISTNLHPADSTIETLFAGLDVAMVKDMNGFWKKEQVPAFNSLKTITAGNGYLVNMNTTGTLTISGTPMLFSNFQIGTSSNWYLIGYPGCTDAMHCVSTPISNYFNATNCQTIKNFEGFWLPNGANNSIQNFEVGKGYFVKK